MKILLVEDEKYLSKALKTILTHNNYSVDQAFDGEEALDFIDINTYDCIILDIMLPKVDGITILRTVRKSGNLVPILMLTAKNEIEDKVKGLDYGADDYLTKPFDTNELLARLRAITRRKIERTENNLKYGDLELDCYTYELICNDNKVSLTSKEYQMMDYFLRNPNEIISATKFLDSIWDEDSDVDITSIWTYISYLRRKLKQIDSKAEIKAIRNIGYKLEQE